MRDELEQVTLSQRKRVGNVVYEYLLDDLEAAGLGRDFKKLASVPSAPLQVYMNSRPGYLEEAYGEMIASGDAGQNIHPYEENDKQLEKISRAKFDTKMKKHTEIISMCQKELEDIAKECFLEEATKEKTDALGHTMETQTTPQGSDIIKLCETQPLPKRL
ncbi:hypothetical protein SERLA73DRAFT_151306 [Serpula lacrymans var. lacrymans S7.3]|uniref:Uncharacterized protein n=1 Tax=Serpula lacrymans var. lacrymans (strain S7.3) TaxID=936435 RepID=F8PRE3_SERL3|nr:hypothetical protein SERLA73DRAFT_151306 [Serpula lacrymans var. lacrymans S7.3]